MPPAPLRLPAALVLPGVHGAARFIEPGAVPALDATEAALMETAAPRRRTHFATGRACAHAALSALGAPTAAVLRSEAGAPVWPAGVVGSIAHCERLAAAVVARAIDWQALGIDVEPARPLPVDVAGYALTDEERRRFAGAGARPEAALLAFSAKECVHKCVHPLLDLFLEFDEVEILIGEQRFELLPRSARAQAALSSRAASGRWAIADGCVWTLLALG